MPMTQLASLAQLDELLAASATQPVLFFKHSTRCPVSGEAQGELLAWARALPDDSPLQVAHLDLLRHREVSDAIASRLGVTHQSPQAILVRAGQVVWQASHWRITQATLAAACATPTP